MRWWAGHAPQFRQGWGLPSPAANIPVRSSFKILARASSRMEGGGCMRPDTLQPLEAKETRRDKPSRCGTLAKEEGEEPRQITTLLFLFWLKHLSLSSPVSTFSPTALHAYSAVFWWWFGCPQRMGQTWKMCWSCGLRVSGLFDSNFSL